MSLAAGAAAVSSSAVAAAVTSLSGMSTTVLVLACDDARLRVSGSAWTLRVVVVAAFSCGLADDAVMAVVTAEVLVVVAVVVAFVSLSSSWPRPHQYQ